MDIKNLLTGKILALLLFPVLIFFVLSLLLFSGPKPVLNVVNGGSGISISGGVVPHHLVAEKIIDRFFGYISTKKNIGTIVLIGPDHFDVTGLTGDLFATVAPETGEFLNLSVDTDLLADITGHKLFYNTVAVSSDHSISALAPFIVRYLPQVKILPIIVSSRATVIDIEELVGDINKYSRPDTIIVASVDFSHYLPPEAAAFHDVKSVSVLTDFRIKDFAELEVDSWQSLYAVRLFSKLRGMEFSNVIGQSNAIDFMGSDANTDSEGTTSYFSVVYENQSHELDIKTGQTLLFVGDMMFNRGVEDLIKKNGYSYPFKQIDRFLSGVDIVVGNLEGPVVKDHIEVPYDSLRFNFPSQTADSLFWADFDLVSLANNHTHDRGTEGFTQTGQFLTDTNVGFVGHPITCGDESVSVKGDVVFMAFNKTFPQNCSDGEISQLINMTKNKHPEKFHIVMIHWGNEYQLTNSSSQQKLGHDLIDAGAEVVIGHHPHVVQNIEIYKGKPIFYSLGNFIFDQYFSLETQEGLAVGVELYDSQVKYRLFPVNLHNSQPFLMPSIDRISFLEKLALRSNPNLSVDIKNGILSADR